MNLAQLGPERLPGDTLGLQLQHQAMTLNPEPARVLLGPPWLRIRKGLNSLAGGEAHWGSGFRNLDLGGRAKLFLKKSDFRFLFQV